MLKNITIQNYKAFHKKTTLDISNINILLWKNSVWKSSILEIFMLLTQTLESDNLKSFWKSHLLLNGKLLKLWKNHDFLYSSSDCKEKSFNITLEISSDFIIDFIDELRHSLRYRLLDLKIKNSKISDYKDNKKIDQILKIINNQNHNKEDKFYSEKLSDLKEVLILIKYFNNFKNSKKIVLDINFILSNWSIIINRYKIFYWKTSKPIIDIQKKWKKYLMLGYTQIFWWKEVKFNTIIPFLVDENKAHKNDFLFFSFHKNGILKRLFNSLWNQLKDVFNQKNIFHITPLRANPQRHYMLDEFYNFSSDIWESLVQELQSATVKHFVNKWFNNFWLEISTDGKESSVLRSLKVKQYWWNRDIVDVGFWISQILPIIVQSMIIPKWSILLIEQPEIHLHPSMQSRLADLFIDIINQRNLHLVIETHSEYFLNRLKLRLAQTKNNSITEWRITKDKINIYFFDEDSKKSYTKVKKIKIHDYWKIDFPKWFKDNEINDSFLYMQEILKLNNN